MTNQLQLFADLQPQIVVGGGDANATGPWIKSSDVEPPKDGRWVVGWNGYKVTLFLWSTCSPSKYTGWYDDSGTKISMPDYWASINEPEG